MAKASIESTTIAITSKNIFSRDSLGWLRIVILIQLAFISCQIVFLLIQFYNKPAPINFPLNKYDQLINPVPLDKPSLTDAELLNWVTEAMIVSFSFNYHNYNNISEKIEEYFDSVGTNSYLKMISEHKQIQQVVSKKLILSGRPTAAPRIVKDGVVDGRYAWQILLPFIFKFNNQKMSLDSELTLDLLVVRTPEQESALGVKIVKVQDLRDSNKPQTQPTQSQQVTPASSIPALSPITTMTQIPINPSSSAATSTSSDSGNNANQNFNNPNNSSSTGSSSSDANVGSQNTGNQTGGSN